MCVYLTRMKLVIFVAAERTVIRTKVTCQVAIVLLCCAGHCACSGELAEDEAQVLREDGLVTMPITVGMEAGGTLPSGRVRRPGPSGERPVAVPPRGSAAPAPVVSKRRSRPTALPAETGRPETSAECARRMRGRFVLCGPRERPEGGWWTMSHILPAIEHNRWRVLRVPDDTPATTECSPRDEARDEALAVLDRDGLLRSIRDHYAPDSFLSLIHHDPDQFRDFVLEDGYIYLRLNGRRVLCVPSVTVDGQSVRAQLIDQVHSVLAHLGSAKTLAYLREHVWWKEMAHDVQAFCDSCMTCRRSKPSNQKPY